MQVIGEVGPCVGRDVSFSRNFEKVHVLEGSDYLVGAELLPGAVDLLRKVLVYDERKEAGEEVCGNAVVPLKEYGTRLELRFGEPEAVLDYPSPAIDLYDFRSVVPKVCADAVEAVKTGFLLYHLLIEGIAAVLGDLAVDGALLALDEALGVVLALAEFLSGAVLYALFGSRYLFFSYMLQVVAVLEREGHDQSLLQFFPRLAEFGLYPAFPTEEPVRIFVRIQLGQVVFLL